MKKTTLWLYVIVLGITFGAGLYEARIVVPEWINQSDLYWNADAANHSDTGMRFWVFVTSIPLTLLTIASLIFLKYSEGSLRKWWAVSACAALADRIMTFGFFVPQMLHLMDYGNSSEAKIVEAALFWADLNYLRLALVLVAWIASMKALTILITPTEKS